MKKIIFIIIVIIFCFVAGGYIVKEFLNTKNSQKSQNNLPTTQNSIETSPTNEPTNIVSPTQVMQNDSNILDNQKEHSNSY